MGGFTEASAAKRKRIAPRSASDSATYSQAPIEAANIYERYVLHVANLHFFLLFSCCLATKPGEYQFCTSLHNCSLCPAAFPNASIVHPLHCFKSSSHCLLGFSLPLLHPSFAWIIIFAKHLFLCMMSVVLQLSSLDGLHY